MGGSDTDGRGAGDDRMGIPSGGGVRADHGVPRRCVLAPREAS